MGDVDKNVGANKLAGVLQKRTKAISEKPSVVDVGEILEDMSLLCNKFPLPIPQSDYMVCRSVCLGSETDVLTQSQTVGEVNSGGHGHEMEEKDEMDESGHGHELEVSCSEGGTLSGSVTGGAHTHEILEDLGHLHDVLVGEKLRCLQSGDRVLVVWIDSCDPCVVDLILRASDIE